MAASEVCAGGSEIALALPPLPVDGLKEHLYDHLFSNLDRALYELYTVLEYDGHQTYCATALRALSTAVHDFEELSVRLEVQATASQTNGGAPGTSIHAGTSVRTSRAGIAWEVRTRSLNRTGPATQQKTELVMHMLEQLQRCEEAGSLASADVGACAPCAEVGGEYVPPISPSREVYQSEPARELTPSIPTGGHQAMFKGRGSAWAQTVCDAPDFVPSVASVKADIAGSPSGSSTAPPPVSHPAGECTVLEVPVMAQAKPLDVKPDVAPAATAAAAAAAASECSESAARPVVYPATGGSGTAALPPRSSKSFAAAVRGVVPPKPPPAGGPRGTAHGAIASAPASAAAAAASSPATSRVAGPRSLHTKLSFPERMRPTPEETARRTEDRLRSAELNRDKIEVERRARLQAKAERVKDVNEKLRQEHIGREFQLQGRLSAASERYTEQIRARRHKAEVEVTKVQEVSFINSVELEARKAEMLERERLADARKESKLREIRERSRGEAAKIADSLQSHRERQEATAKARLEAVNCKLQKGEERRRHLLSVRSGTSSAGAGIVGGTCTAEISVADASTSAVDGEVIPPFSDTTSAGACEALLVEPALHSPRKILAESHRKLPAVCKRAVKDTKLKRASGVGGKDDISSFSDRSYTASDASPISASLLNLAGKRFHDLKQAFQAASFVNDTTETSAGVPLQSQVIVENSASAPALRTFKPATSIKIKNGEPAVAKSSGLGTITASSSLQRVIDFALFLLGSEYTLAEGTHVAVAANMADLIKRTEPGVPEQLSQFIAAESSSSGHDVHALIQLASKFCSMIKADATTPAALVNLVVVATLSGSPKPCDFVVSIAKSLSKSLGTVADALEAAYASTQTKSAAVSSEIDSAFRAMPAMPCGRRIGRNRQPFSDSLCSSASARGNSWDSDFATSMLQLSCLSNETDADEGAPSAVRGRKKPSRKADADCTASKTDSKRVGASVAAAVVIAALANSLLLQVNAAATSRDVALSQATHDAQVAVAAVFSNSSSLLRSMRRVLEFSGRVPVAAPPPCASVGYPWKDEMWAPCMPPVWALCSALCASIQRTLSASAPVSCGATGGVAAVVPAEPVSGAVAASGPEPSSPHSSLLVADADATLAVAAACREWRTGLVMELCCSVTALVSFCCGHASGSGVHAAAHGSSPAGASTAAAATTASAAAAAAAAAREPLLAVACAHMAALREATRADPAHAAALLFGAATAPLARHLVMGVIEAAQAAAGWAHEATPKTGLLQSAAAAAGPRRAAPSAPARAAALVTALCEWLLALLLHPDAAAASAAAAAAGSATAAAAVLPHSGDGGEATAAARTGGEVEAVGGGVRARVQAVLSWGPWPSALHQLCGLPLPYFNGGGAAAAAVARALCAACDGCETNAAIVRGELAAEMLESMRTLLLPAAACSDDGVS